MLLRFTGLLLILQLSVHAQDTLRITLRQADSLLAVRNLSLIALHYEVDMADAAIRQARLLNNPTLSTEWNLYNPEKSEWFDVGRNGQKILALEQMFSVSGERNAAIKLALGQKRLTQSQYLEVVRALKYQLHVAYHRHHYLSNAIRHIRTQLGLLKNLIDVYDENYRKGNISLQELTRLNSTYFLINNQVTDIEQELVALQQRLRVLLSEDRFVEPEGTDSEPGTLPATPDELIEQALRLRPELESQKIIEEQARLRHSLARKQSAPLLSAGAVYDQAGSYIRNYTGVTVGLQVPIFNRNQGAIQAAKIGIEQARISGESLQQQIRNEVIAAWQVFRILQDQFSAVKPGYEGELDLLSAALVKNYTKNNISLLEFTDLFEAYNTNIIQYNQLKADLNKSYEELLYAVGE